MSKTTALVETLEVLEPEEVLQMIASGRGDFNSVLIKGDLILGKKEETVSFPSSWNARIVGMFAASGTCKQDEKLDLRGAVVEKVFLHDLTVSDEVNLASTKARSIEIHDSDIGSLILDNVELIENLKILHTKIRGDLDLSYIKVPNRIDFDHVEVEGDILCKNNVPLALQCFLYFGKKVALSNYAIRTACENLGLYKPQRPPQQPPSTSSA